MKEVLLGLVVLSLFACKTGDKTTAVSESKDKSVTEEKKETIVPEPNTRGINTTVVAPAKYLSAPVNTNSNPNNGARPK